MKLKIVKFVRPILASLILGSLLLSACGNLPALNPATATPTTAPTATPVPQKTLVICLGDEPSSLYLYGNSSQSMWSVLESIYDGPIDTVNYEPQPVILENIPTQENGEVTIQAAPVSEGDLVANTEGDLVALEKGVTVFQDGCTTSSCATPWDGTSAISLSQMVVKFKLLDGLKWSDGQPLTAADSVYSYQVAADRDTNVSKTLVNKTASYTALDTQTVEWVGVPGYLTLNPSAFFWSPLPQHALSQYTASELNTVDATNRTPLGWGPYMIDQWQAGDHIRLVKNPYYFRASEGLPKFDVVVYRFLGNVPQADLSPILTGECDIIDTSVNMSDQIQTIRSLEEQGKIKGYYGQGPDWEAINFGIKPSSYDDGFNPFIDRPDFFSDVRTRQAFADCIDRQSIVSTYTFNLSDVPTTYLTSKHPYFVQDLPSYTYDPAAGEKLLDEVGWVDKDGNPDTPRVSQGISTVVNGTPFEVTYVTTDSETNDYIAESIASNLGQCGIKMDIKQVPIADMYAPGPDGLVFGRNFDLAQLGWTVGRQNPCFLFSTSEIPTAKNSWLGTKYGGVNLTGYSNPVYDQACENYLTAGLDADAANAANQQALTQLANDVPFIPLFFNVKVMISRPDLCGLSLDVSSRSGLKDIEKLDIGTCK